MQRQWNSDLSSCKIFEYVALIFNFSFIKLLFFDNGGFTIKDYVGQTAVNTVLLLIKPGHYNIGLK